MIPLHDDEPLPETGFFAIECLGKNKITVGTHKVEQGEVAQLENETPIRMSTVCLFFLLPTDARETAMEIPDPHAHKRKRVSSANSEYSSAKRAATSGSALQQELDNMSTEELLEEMKKAMDAGEWTVRHRFMGGVLAYRAVQDASRSKKIRAIVQEHGGIQKKDIIDYIAKNPTYSAWVKHHLGRVEFQSYQALVTKVLQKAGYERVGTKKTGRFVRWNLPKSAQEEEAVSDDEMEEAENDIDDNDESASAEVTTRVMKVMRKMTGMRMLHLGRTVMPAIVTTGRMTFHPRVVRLKMSSCLIPIQETVYRKVTTSIKMRLHLEARMTAIWTRIWKTLENMMRFEAVHTVVAAAWTYNVCNLFYLM